MEKYDKFFFVRVPCSKTSMLVFVQGRLSRKNVSRTIFASVNYLSSALVKENLSHFSFTLPRKTCQEKIVKENMLACKVGKFSLTSGLVKENLLV